MVDSKTTKINIEAMAEDSGMLRYFPDYFKTKKRRKHVVKNLSFLKKVYSEPI